MANNILTRLTLDSSDFTRKLNMSSGQAKRFKSQMSGIGKGIAGAFSGLGGAFSAISPSVIGLTGAVTGLSAAFARGVALNREWQQELTTLGNQCRYTAEELNNLKMVAQELSTQTMTTATEILQSMQTIAAGMPELRDNWLGLGETAKAAATLATASNLTLEDSTARLVSMFNTFGVSSESAMRYVNALAAAAKAGGGDVNYLTQIIDKVGNSAHQCGIPFEKLLGYIEGIAPRFPDASKAAAQFEMVLGKLQKAGGDLDPRIVGLDKAIQNLGNRCTTAKDYMEVLGNRAYAMGEALVETQKDAENFEGQIKNTTEAEDQCQKQMESFDGQVKRLQGSWDNLTTTLGNSTGAFAKVMGFLDTLVQGLERVISTIDDVIEKYRVLAGIQIEKNSGDLYGLDVETYKKYGFNDKGAAYKAWQDQGRDLNANTQKWKDAERRLNKTLGFSRYKTLEEMAGDYEAARYWLGYKQANNEKIRQHNSSRPWESVGKTNAVTVTGLPETSGNKSGTRNGRRTTTGRTTTGRTTGRAVVTAHKPTVPQDPYAELRKIWARLGYGQDEIDDFVRGLNIDDVFKKEEDALQRALLGLEKGTAEWEVVAEQLAKLQLARHEWEHSGEDKNSSAAFVEAAMKEIGHPNYDGRNQRNKDYTPQIKDAQERISAAIKEMYLGDKAKGQAHWKQASEDLRAYKVLQYNNVDRTTAALMTSGKGLLGEDMKTTLDAVKEMAKTLPKRQDFTIPEKINPTETIGAINDGLSSIGSLLSSFGLEGAGKTISKITGIVSSVLAVLTAINTILIAIGVRKLLPFADGGIVGGHSFTGDRILARLNSGEMVLNKKQQAALGYTLSQSGGGTTQLQAVVKGEDIYLSSSNYYKRTGKKV